jgi:hypothetical protein
MHIISILHKCLKSRVFEASRWIGLYGAKYERPFVVILSNTISDNPAKQPL